MFGVILFSFFVSACEENVEEVFTLSLLDEEETIQVFEELEKGDIVDLPVLDKEGYIFLGWQGDKDLYYDEYTVEETTSFQAVYEEVSAVFTYELVNGDAFLTSYDGNASHLKVPVMIDGYVVRGLKSNVFDGGEMLGLKIPLSVFVIEHKAIANMEDLNYVGFYGDYLGELETLLGKDDYEELLSGEDVLCEKTEISARNWTFSGACPVKEVLGHTDPVEVNGEEIITYQVILDRKYYDDGESSHYFSLESFYNLPSLKEVLLPSRYREFQGNMFSSVPALEHVTFSGESMYESLEDGVYIEDGTHLLYYYPSGLKRSISLGDQVLGVDYFAFVGDQVVETITLPVNFSYQGFRPFHFMHQLKALKEVQVDGEGELYTVDGVLYLNAEEMDIHVIAYYPRAREHTSYRIEDGVNSLSLDIFEYNTYLEEIYVPTSVEYMYIVSSVSNYFDRVILERSILEDGSITELRSQGVLENMPNFYMPDDSYEAYLSHYSWAVFEDYIKPVSELE